MAVRKSLAEARPNIGPFGPCWRGSRPARSAPMKNREMEISALLVLLLFALIAFAKDKPAEVKGGNGIILPPPLHSWLHRAE